MRSTIRKERLGCRAVQICTTLPLAGFETSTRGDYRVKCLKVEVDTSTVADTSTSAVGGESGQVVRHARVLLRRDGLPCQLTAKRQLMACTSSS